MLSALPGRAKMANTTVAKWLGDGRSTAEVGRLFAGFTAWSGPFRSAIDAHGRPQGQTPAKPESTDA